ncbi:glycosyltransferase family 4 protein [Catenulispora pinisilvae]|uniref:glycosyltransferase family 4 protein n=1 Tax=Catenulispora pinisilvae TaxID=2705253 RepID=UPI001890FAA9|nr:glycosyltransferase family 4 protein [Catenulispora pinisilvae]
MVSAGWFPPYLEEVAAQAEAGTRPKVWLYDLPYDLTVLDQRFVTGPSRVRRALYRRLPLPLAFAVEAFRVRKRYDAIFAWGAEAASLPLALALRFTRGRTRTPLVVLYSWISSGAKAKLLRLAWPGIKALVLPPSAQAEFAVKQLGVPTERITSPKWVVDTGFWNPELVDPQPAEPRAGDPKPDDQDTVMICSAGREMRDFATLIAALDGTGVRCHIAGSLVAGMDDRWRAELGDRGERVGLPEGVTFGPLTPVEMRDLYARSRFVVLPLHPSDTDHGISCMIEAFAMGRAVVCTRFDGQRDALEEGVNGVFVPAHDAAALRTAILELIADPERAAAMGRAARRAAEAEFGMARWVAALTEVLDAAIG